MLALVALSRVVSVSALSLSTTVGSHMVIQRDVATLSLWGTAKAGAAVTATLSTGTAFPATAGADGVFRVPLPAMGATTTPFNITFSTAGDPDVTIYDVVVGDVILCSGREYFTACRCIAILALTPSVLLDPPPPQQRVTCSFRSRCR
jgi:hypothetical protein